MTPGGSSSFKIWAQNIKNVVGPFSFIILLLLYHLCYMFFFCKVIESFSTPINFTSFKQIPFLIYNIYIMEFTEEALKVLEFVKKNYQGIGMGLFIVDGIEYVEWYNDEGGHSVNIQDIVSGNVFKEYPKFLDLNVDWNIIIDGYT